MVDILLAVYNGEKYLKEQLCSIINQTYKEFNIIVRDDGSTDNSLSIIRGFEALYPHQIKVIEGAPSGSAKNNFFELMNYTVSDYIMFCDQDDVWLENKIEITLKKMKETESVHGKSTPILCHTDLKVVDRSLDTINSSFFKMQKFDISKTSLNHALVQNIVTGCTIMINKALLELAKDTNSDDIIMHDWWLFLIASAFGRIETITTPAILYRQHEENQLGAKTLSPMTHRQMTNSVRASIKQAYSFLQCYHELLSLSQVEMIQYYSNIYKYSFLKRVFILRKFKFYKHPFIKKFFQTIIILKLKGLTP